jgi:peptidoglycan/xylan/chitin deacetylase (PgdA/CDA1 family)
MWLLVVAVVSSLVLAHTAPFPFILDRMAPAHAVWRMPATDPPTIYLTFDDGPNPTATPDLLDVLRKNRASATFFVIDDYVSEDTAPMLRRMADEGHVIALHANSRALMITSPEDVAGTLMRHAARIERLAGARPCRLFRPHAGWRSGTMIAGLRKIDHQLVGWSFGLWDFNWYRRPDAAGLAARLARRASAGDIVVMHDGHHVDPRADRTHTVAAVRRLVPALTARGFQFGTLCDPQSSWPGAGDLLR